MAPASYVDTNIHGTLNVIQAARELSTRRVIHTSTSETYGSAQFVPITEEHPLVGQSPYAASKIGADQLALSYWKSFKTPITVIRPFNTYGPRQSARAIIPTIITQILSGKTEIALGSTSPTRDFNYVEDTCLAFLKLSQSKSAIGRVVNSASNYEISIKDLAKVIADIMQVKIKIVSEEKRLRPKLSEVNRLYGDNTLLKNLTDWEPSYSGKNGLIKGLTKTIDWFSDTKNLAMYPNDKYIV
jgi:nucleoside-diphosphate-sugar epimerase